MNTDMIAFEAEMRRLRGAYIFDIAPAIEMYRALLTRVEVLDVAFANSHQLNESLGDENRALLARAEAAEAEAARLRDENAEAWHAFDRQQSRGDRLAARVAELEATLAAQQWRPVTNEWPPQEESTPVRMRNGVIRWGYRHGDRWHLTGGQYSRESVTHAYALPPAPAAAEATE